ncbi:MAG TPA: hypothetical protein VM573_10265 [Actinomycetota bacterium]|jgi:hypothetical protein|nr:hypothetical protein [Actinomycetota bacterium]
MNHIIEPLHQTDIPTGELCSRCDGDICLAAAGDEVVVTCGCGSVAALA